MAGGGKNPDGFLASVAGGALGGLVSPVRDATLGARAMGSGLFSSGNYTRPVGHFFFRPCAAAVFPALMMGIFSKRINSAGATAGMLVGLVIYLSVYGLVLYPRHQQL